VIGDPCAPADATVVVGSPTELAGYLDGQLTTSLTGATAQARQALSVNALDAARPRPQAAAPPAPPLPAGDLISLPHTGLAVPHTRLEVTSLKQLETSCGVAFTATLRLQRQVVGTVENEGSGGPTTFYPHGRATFGHRHLDQYAAGCRSATGETVTAEHVMDDLVTEYETGRSIRRANAKGKTLLREMEFIYDDDDQPVGEPFAAGQATCRPPLNLADRAALLRQLPPSAGHRWWQIWTGARWEDLTPRPDGH
jgi:hypothetical protein